MITAVRSIARQLLLCCALVAPGVSPTAASAQAVAPPDAPAAAQPAAYTPEVEREARAIFADILSPYCPGLTLTACPSQGAFVLKDSIRKQLAVGLTTAQVWAELEARFGESIYAKPKARGVGLLAWIGPYVAIALAGLLLTWWLRRASARGREKTPLVLASEPSLSDERRAALDAALRRDA
ncbi:MAG: cytochrome c-type biogenesis protein CcmH [Gemmatimonadaceae bacterium]